MDSPKPPIGPWGWTGRTTVAIFVGYALYKLDEHKLVDVGRLADVVTVLVPALAVYTLFDTRLLEWVVRKIRVVIERVRASLQRQAAAPQRSAAAAASQRPPQVTPSPTILVEPDLLGLAAVAGSPTNIPNPAQAERSGWRKWLVALLVPFAVLVAIILFGERVWTTMIGPLFDGEVQEPGPVKDSAGRLPPLPPPVEPAPVATITAIEGDSCWAIARRCTGSGVRYNELGPPLNDIDVSAACPIRAGRTIMLPTDWPKECKR